jgi:hypothetical protein
MTKSSQPDFSLNDDITLQPKEALSLYYSVKILPNLTEQYPIFQLLSVEFFSKFLEEIYPDIFSELSRNATQTAGVFIFQRKENQLVDYIKQISFVSPELFFDNIAVIRQRVLDCWLFPLKHDAKFHSFLNPKIENGLIAHYKYKYLLYPVTFVNVSTKIE